MSSGGSASIRAAQAFVELITKDAGFRRGLAGALTRLRGWQVSVKTIFTALSRGTTLLADLPRAFNTLANATTAASAFADKIAKASSRTGIDVQSIQGLMFAAEQTGASFEELEASLKIMQKGFGQGDASFIQAVESLGLSFADVAARTPDQQFIAIASAIGKITDPASKVAAALDIFGRGGSSLVPLFNSGQGGIVGLINEASRLGVVLSADDVSALVSFGDEVAKVFIQAELAFVKIVAAMLPVLSEAATGLQELGIEAFKWLEAAKLSETSWMQTIVAIARGIRAGRFDLLFELVAARFELFWRELVDSILEGLGFNFQEMLLGAVERFNINVGHPAALNNLFSRQDELRNRIAEILREMDQAAAKFDATKTGFAPPPIRRADLTPPPLNTIRAHLAAVVASVHTVAAGTFNASAASALGRGGPRVDDPVVAALEKMNDDAEHLRDDVARWVNGRLALPVI